MTKSGKNYKDLKPIPGGEGLRLTEPDQLASALQTMLTSPKPFILDAIVNPKELTMPPKIAAVD